MMDELIKSAEAKFRVHVSYTCWIDKDTHSDRKGHTQVQPRAECAAGSL